MKFHSLTVRHSRLAPSLLPVAGAVSRHSTLSRLASEAGSGDVTAGIAESGEAPAVTELDETNPMIASVHNETRNMWWISSILFPGKCHGLPKCLPYE